LEAGDDGDLAARLSHALYVGWYRRPRPEDSEAPVASEEFAAALIAKNPLVDRWDRDWSITKVVGNGVAIKKAQRERYTSPGHFVVRNPGSVPRDGAKVDLFVPRDNTQLQRGYYYVFGSALEFGEEGPHDVRFYFAIEPSEAVELLRWLTAELNEFCVPFRFKCGTDPRTYNRADTAVLYVARRFFQIVALIVRYGWQVGARDVPAMTHPIANGVSVAESPPGPRSFGDQRCSLLAAALAPHLSQRAARREKAIVEAFRHEGLDVTRPWLNAGSEDLYAPSIG
jgi:hypothetical protein